MVKRLVEIGLMLLCITQGAFATTAKKAVKGKKSPKVATVTKTPAEVQTIDKTALESMPSKGNDVLEIQEQKPVVVAIEEDNGPIEIYNTKSGAYTNIDNFDYAIDLPNTGYKQTSANLATTFTNEVSNATIVISQPAVDENNTPEEGVEYKINGKKAFLVSKDDKNEGRAIKVLRLMASYPLIIEASCNATDTFTINQLEKCLISVVPTVYAKNENTFENNAFSISNGGYKAQSSGTNFTIFTPSGKSEFEEIAGKGNYFQILVTKRDANQKATNKEAKEIINGLVDNNFKGGKIVKSQKTTINGTDGFEYEIERKNGEGIITDKSYAVVLNTAKCTYLFLSNANSDIEQNLEKYKEIAKTLKTK